MGEVYAEVILKANGKESRRRLLVDTASTFSWISSETLNKLEVKPTDEEELETIEGKIV